MKQLFTNFLSSIKFCLVLDALPVSATCHTGWSKN